MLYATNRFPGDGMTTQYEISFVGGYLDRTHVKAYVEGADLVQTPIPLTSGNFIGPYTIGGLTPAPVGSTVVIYRDTPKAPIVDFVNGSRFTESNLDTATRQGSFIAAEGADAVSPAGLAGVIQQVTDFSAAAGVARAQAVAAKDTAVASSDAASLSKSNANDSALSAATDAASAMNNKNLSDTAASNASVSASEALGYRNTAQTAATNASASESTAATQAGVATTQATAAAASATAAAASAASIAAGPVASVNGRAGVVVLAKADVGLSNVDNTSDANKPVSTAQAAAIDLRYGKNNILGTVSQAAGVPTGAVIERGSNANGDYVRFADGTQICTATQVGGALTRSAYSGITGLYRSDLVWTYPATFAAPPHGATGSGEDQGITGWVSVAPRATTSAGVTYLSSSPTVTGYTFVLLAIGRWF